MNNSIKSNISTLSIIIFIGLLAIVGVFIMQLSMLYKAYVFERNETEDKIHFSLQEVVRKIYRDNQHNLPITNQIKKISSDYYIVNIDDVFDAQILEYYLKTEFEVVKLDIDFEYAIYDCQTDRMVYGDYVSRNKQTDNQCFNCFEKREDLTYYFAIRFPQMKYSIFASMSQYWIFTGVLCLALVIYVYSILLLMKQRRYSALQTEFINNMTHEFKTPLSSILIASKFASEQSEIKQNQKLSKYLEIVIFQTKKLNHHIERILTVAKGEANWIKLDIQPFSLSNTLELIKENIILKSKKKVLIDIKLSVPDSLNGDYFHLNNVFYNLVDNALKYSDEDVEIKIFTTQKSQFTLLHFEDNGIGIPNEYQEYIFDKFFRIPQQHTRNNEGFGIGLAYVKKIIELHKWQISIQNNPEKGCTFTITIPNKCFTHEG